MVELKRKFLEEHDFIRIAGWDDSISACDFAHEVDVGVVLDHHFVNIIYIN